jgi:hypothetical protein
MQYKEHVLGKSVSPATYILLGDTTRGYAIALGTISTLPKLRCFEHLTDRINPGLLD